MERDWQIGDVIWFPGDAECFPGANGSYWEVVQVPRDPLNEYRIRSLARWSHHGHEQGHGGTGGGMISSWDIFYTKLGESYLEGLAECPRCEVFCYLERDYICYTCRHGAVSPLSDKELKE